jgi:uncharacterized protein
MKALVCVTLIAAVAATAAPAPDAEHIYVTGLGKAKAVPDLVEISVRIEKTDKDLRVAKQSVDERTLTVVDAAKRHGVHDEDITSARLYIHPEYHWDRTNRIFDGNLVSRYISLTLRDIATYNSLIKSLVDANITSIRKLEMSSTKREELEQEARSAALADAKAKASAMAADLGARLGPVYSISEQQPDGYRDEMWGVVGSRVSENVDKEEVFKPGTITYEKRAFVVFRLVSDESSPNKPARR